MSGPADVLVERLRAVGTRMLFGVPGGGGNLDLIEAAHRANLPFVLMSTETGAAIAAMAQAEVLGRPGACLTTLGPGAASVVNGVACAYLDRAPMVVFTDSSSLAARRFSHQQLDQLAMFAPITKWSGQLTPGDTTGVIDRAFHELTGLPPGPVHIDCPGDAWGASEAGRPSETTRPEAEPVEAPRVDALLTGARRPLLIVGLGARQKSDAAAIRHLCERLHLPAMVTYKAKGVVPDAHECFAGVFTNGAIEREIIAKADLLIGIGLDPIELLPRPWTFTQPIIGINRWRVPDDHVPFAEQWVTDIASAAAMLEAHMRPSEWNLDEVAHGVAEQRRLIDIDIDVPADGMSAQRVVDMAAHALAAPSDAQAAPSRAQAAPSRLTVDAGAHMLPATMRWPVWEPNGLLISNGLSTMGFALPAAIGAALLERKVEAGARPRPTVALIGDGGLLMCAGELLTAAREKLRIITIVFSDASLSLIEIKQQARQLPPAGVALGVVRWAALAESLGVAGFVASNEGELARAIDQAIACDGPSLIEAKIDRSNYGAMLRAIRG